MAGWLRWSLVMQKKENMIEWIEEARQIAAQCWCDPDTENTEMDPILAEAVAKRIAFWMETAAQNECNTDYYRGLVQRIGRAIGQDAYTQDDGGISEDVLCAKVPELVETIVANQAAAPDNTPKKYINLYWNEINNRVKVGNCIFDKEDEAKNNGKLVVNLCSYLKTVEIELPEGDVC